MHNLINEAPAKKNYDFIDAIRSIAMMAIVAEHSIGAGGYTFTYGTPKYWAYITLTQIAKFGTISFFLLAGFLIGEKFTDYTPAQYLKRRVSTTFGPWLFWTFVYVVGMIITLRIKERIYHNGDFNLSNILNNIKIIYLYSNYWFIINFLVSISILLIFRKHLYSWLLGLVLGLFSLFYAVNIHLEWISPKHTTAILGFVFFLWLGAQIRKHKDAMEIFAERLSYPLLLLLLIVTFGLSVFEIDVLSGKSVDPVNTLRISNILFSLVCFMLLFKIKSFRAVNYLKPRQTTFGIYLIHYLVLIFLLPEIFIHFNINVYDLTVPQYLLFKLITFMLAYGITFGMVVGINNSPFKKLVGN
nr:acyltransferase [uncultured Mucilaginibacter sp.]